VLPILLLHALRHLGDVSRSGSRRSGLPEHSHTGGFRRLIAAVLALIAIAAVVRRSQFARPLVGPSTSGTIDLMIAISLATIYGAAPYMGAAYWIPAFWSRHCS